MIVIFGGSGFVASNLSQCLSDEQRPFVNFGRQDLNLISCDTSQILEKYTEEDIIIFISAIAPCKTSFDLLQNILMVTNLGKALTIRKPRKVIYISSDAVYQDSSAKLDEDSPRGPGNPHGQMHFLREQILDNVCGDVLSIIRPTLIYGFGDTHNGYGPNLFLNKCLRDEHIYLFGNGEELRDHIWIKDLSRLILNVIDDTRFVTVNGCSGKVLSFADIAAILASKFKKDILIKKRDRLGPIPHNGYRAFDITRQTVLYPDFSWTSLDNAIDDIISESI